MSMEPDFEKQKLVPAIVQDYKTKEILMLAYVNEESYKYMIENKQTCFYSRSREKLWIKGETSGNYQYIKNMYLDCDRDTILIQVDQVGNACHTGNYSCFFNKVMKAETPDVCGKQNFKQEDVDYDNTYILQKIYDKIVDRSINPIENSYTNYLLNEGVDKICKKVGEEATETVIAAKNESKDELVGEISDLVYHTLVLMFNRNISLKDIENKLSDRHKIDRNKKVFNKRGEY